MLIAVTGTPGTGKSYFSRELAKSLAGAKLIEINDVVKEHRLYSGIGRDNAMIVKTRQLEKKLEADIAKSRGVVVLAGHLAADLKLRYDICVVTRSSLSRLVRVFKKRRYGAEKARENLLAEALDYCGIVGFRRSKETYEVETAQDKRKVIAYIKKRAAGKKAQPPSMRRINAMPELLRMIKAGSIRP